MKKYLQLAVFTFISITVFAQEPAPLYEQEIEKVDLLVSSDAPKIKQYGADESIAKDSRIKPAENNDLTTREARLFEIRDRINEIKNLDRNKLSSAEKKLLRAEVEELRHELRGLKRESDSTLYIYLGILAAIFIVLLIIL